jgi:hypothetical protein
MKHYEIPVNERFIYIGSKEEWYGQTVIVEAFSVFFVNPAPALRREYGNKSRMKCAASILHDGFSTTCDLHELLPINEAAKQ